MVGEVFYSNYRAAQCLQQLGAPYTEILAAYENCFRKFPHRAEPLVRAATLARQQDRFHDGYVMSRRATGVAKPDNTALFVENNDYEFRALDEQAIAAYYCGLPDEAFELCSKLLDHRALPDSDRSRIEKNRDYSVPHIKQALLRYDAELIANLSSRQPALTPRVTLAVTSCRRLDLFIGTVCSFINACSDLDLVDRFICVDDNSSAEDRDEMKRRFPFFEFIEKERSDRGHARSLNLIRKAVRTPWLVHLEDDWHFFARRPYIGPALEILEEDPELGQVLFNRNYAETLDDREIVGGFPRSTVRHGYRYVVHEHYAGESTELRRLHGRNNSYWPHYSLRPSVVRTNVLERVGSFDENAAHFELDYAQRFVQAGFRSAFYDGIYALHTGRLTSERGDPTRLNAYDLNGWPQFESFPRVPCHDIPPSAHADRGQCFAKALGVRLINLDRRPDRFNAFTEHLADLVEPEFASRVQRFPAIDGLTLLLTREIEQCSVAMTSAFAAE